MNQVVTSAIMTKFLRAVIVMIAFVVLANGIIVDPLHAVDHDQVTMRSLQSDTGHRLLIEWANPIKVLQKKNDQQLILRFSRPLTIDAGSIFDRLETYLDASRTKIEGTDLTLTLRNGATANLEIKKKRIVTIDLNRPSNFSPEVEIDVSSLKNGVRLAFAWPHLMHFDSEEKNRELSVTFRSESHLRESDLTYLNKTLQPWFSKVQSWNDPINTKLVFNLQPMIVSSITRLGKNRLAIDFLRSASLSNEVSSATPLPAFKPTPPNPNPSPSAELSLHLPKWRPQAAVTTATDQEEIDIDTLTKPKSDSGIKELVFDWGQEVGTAIFKRAGYLWIVFDAPVNSSQSPIPPPSPYPLEAGRVIKDELATIIRFPMVSDIGINVTNQGGGRWIVRPGSSSTSRSSIPIMPSDQSNVLHAQAQSNGRIVEAIDPVVGDRIGIWPVLQPLLGQQDRRRFVDLDILPSIQGLAWRQRNDDVSANMIADGIEFSSPQGLVISNWPEHVPNESPASIQPYDVKKAFLPSKQNQKVEVTERTKAEEVPSSFLDLAGFHLDREDMTKGRRKLRQLIGTSSPEEQDQIRLDLARLLVAERHASEAKTVLGGLSESIEGVMATSERALWGASILLDGDVEQATSLLSMDEFDQDDEIGIWRAAIISLNENWDAAAPIWKANRKTLDIYPPKLRMKFGLLALETAIRSNDDNMIRVGFRRLKSFDPKPHEIAQIDRLHALRAIRDGDTMRAEEILQDLVKRKLGALSLQADLELATLVLSNDGNNADLLEILNDRLPLWRGHSQEIEMIDSLAGWHRTAHEPRKALDLWEHLSIIYPKTDVDAPRKALRKATFAEAISKLAGHEISLFDAYTIYLDFLDLLPEEPEEKTLHLSLAKHLTDLDLLNEAIHILQPMLDRTANKSEREQIGTELAELLLIMDRPHEVLSVLDRSAASGSHGSGELAAKRQITRARALVGLGQGVEALEQIQNLQTSSARHLRAEVFWKQREWARLASVIESFLNDPSLATPLSHSDQKLILWLALSWDQLGLTNKLRDLRKRYIDEMASGLWSEAFLITTQVESERRDIPSVLADVDEQLAELRDFRKKIGDAAQLGQATR